MNDDLKTDPPEKRTLIQDAYALLSNILMWSYDKSLYDLQQMPRKSYYYPSSNGDYERLGEGATVRVEVKHPQIESICVTNDEQRVFVRSINMK